jgi:hypothetical protein
VQHERPFGVRAQCLPSRPGGLGGGSRAREIALDFA